MATRRSATTAASAPIAGIASSSRIAGRSGGWIASGNQVASSSGTIATSGRDRKNSPIPTMTPRTDARSASTTASRVTWIDVAPTSRSAASRCSRRAADSRVAVETKTATGTSAPMMASTIRRIAIGGISGVGGCGLEPLHRRRAELREGARRHPDDRDELVGRAERRIADGADDRPDPVAELVARRRGDPCRQRRGDERLARTGEPIDARRDRRVVDERREHDGGQSLALVHVVAPSSSARPRRPRCRCPRTGSWFATRCVRHGR